MLLPVGYPFDPPELEQTLIHTLAEAMRELNRAFKTLPGLERVYTPQSDYLYAFFETLLGDLLLLGSDYQSAFERFEALYALEHAHIYDRGDSPFRYWGPVGRFAWKHGVLAQQIAEAESAGASLASASSRAVRWIAR